MRPIRAIQRWTASVVAVTALFLATLLVGGGPAMAASPSTPAPYDVVASWKASTGDTVYLREGTWNGMRGWGYRKVVEYHNLTTAAVKAATMYPKDVRTLGPTTRRFETPVQDLPKRQRLPPPASPR